VGLETADEGAAVILRAADAEAVIEEGGDLFGCGFHGAGIASEGADFAASENHLLQLDFG